MFDYSHLGDILESVSLRRLASVPDKDAAWRAKVRSRDQCLPPLKGLDCVDNKH